MVGEAQTWQQMSNKYCHSHKLKISTTYEFYLFWKNAINLVTISHLVKFISLKLLGAENTVVAVCGSSIHYRFWLKINQAI